MTETETKTAPVKQELPVGGAVMAIVPQTFSELQRVANTVLASGVAPQALLYRSKDGDDPNWVKQRNIAAISTVLMAGAELGVPPMASLRMFTVINGRPALYADGNVAVVRKAKNSESAKVCKRINSGFELVVTPAGAVDDKSFGWCESERDDNGEVHREEFSIADAKQAGLWSPEETVEREVWEGPRGARKPVKRMVPNDAPWHRYWKRMLIWRATGYCLRWLYADILGGMVDEYEAREIEGMIDITPQSNQIMHERAPREEAPEPPPDPDAAEEQSQDAPLQNSDQHIDAKTEAAAEVFDPHTSEIIADTSDLGRYLGDLDTALIPARTEDDVNRIFTETGVESDLADDEVGLTRAYEIRNKHLSRVERIALAEQGQGEIFPGDT